MEITRMEYFAGLAMQELIRHEPNAEEDRVASRAIDMAESMCIILAKREGEAEEAGAKILEEMSNDLKG